MQDPFDKMVEILQENKKFGQIAIKAEFESEGTRSSELNEFNILAKSADLPLVVKIGGCEAIRDLYDCKELRISKIVAPMIESRYAAYKYIKSLNRIFNDDTFKPKAFINVETKTGFQNIGEIAKEISEHLDGIVLGRVDYVYSKGLSREDINSEEILEDALIIAKKCKNHNLDFIVGGGITHSSLQFLKNIFKLKLSNFETRKCVFSSNILGNSYIIKALENSIIFELLWLKFKQKHYLDISREDNNRIEMLESRIKNYHNLAS